MADRRGVGAGGSGCRAQTKRGQPCAGFALTGGEHCLSHDPERAGALREARAKGGAAASKLRAIRGRRSRLDTVPALVGFTAGVIHDALEGRLTPDVARTVLYGLGLQRQLVESSDLERRIAALEARVEGQQPKGRQAWGA